MSTSQIPGLRTLARLYGLQTDHEDAAKELQPASDDGLLRTLRCYGVPIETADQVPAAIAARRLELWQRVAPPVIVAWQGLANGLVVRVPVGLANATLSFSLVNELGNATNSSVALASLPARKSALYDGQEFVAKYLPLPALPLGYFRLHLEVGALKSESLVISSPEACYQDWQPHDRKLWGTFLPLYALRTNDDRAVGDLSDLAAWIDWGSQCQASLAATLPLFSSFVATTEDPSPYSPASRLFWNEFFLDLTAIPDLARSPEAKRLLESSELQKIVADAAHDEFVDYVPLVALKRKILEALAETFFAAPGEREHAFQSFLKEKPDADDYARFRAVGERHGLNWRAWPDSIKNGVIADGDFPLAAYRYHIYAQWQMEEQLRGLIDRAQQAGMTWYLDLPLGVHGDSYDVWRQRDLFALTASGGAPPDIFFTKGQDWGFPPIHPEASRKQFHHYIIRTIRRQLTYAKLLRIDHVMGLHRLYWVPHGVDARSGVYVRYPTQDMFAILALESHRREAGIVGENLGTVPDAVQRALTRHQVLGMYVLPFEIGDPDDDEIREPKATEVASLNTHDIPPFASFWEGYDIHDRHELGLLTPEQVEAEEASRAEQRDKLMRVLVAEGFLEKGATDVASVLEASLAFLAASPARVVLVNLEDLWLERKPQNTPGTWKERPNWRLRARHSLESFRQLSAIQQAIERIVGERGGSQEEHSGF